MTSVAALQRKIGDYINAEDCAKVERAYNYSKNAHLGQVRDSGRPYIQHPLTVADILADWNFDAESIVAALLHDTVEDTSVEILQIRNNFGNVVAGLVEGLSKIQRLEGIDRRAQEAETLRKMLLAATVDWRVLFIKLADRLHNMRTLYAINEPSRRRRIALETLTIYAPLAERLGFSPVQEELQNLAFRYLRPRRYRVLSKAFNNARSSKRQVINRLETTIRKALNNHSIECTLEKRRKNLYSIYKKMEQRRLSFAQVEDIIGFRLIVKDRMACYQAMGALHEGFVPVAARFKDYIAIPKSNGYQSLHTMLITRENIKIEMQIRTYKMHKTAEQGLAAHWVYKQTDSTQTEQTETFKRLSSIVQLHAENASPSDFLEYLRDDLEPTVIFILDADGKTVRLPRDSTALDFAYAIHTDIGDHAESATINNNVMPLSRRLNTGDKVSIKTHPDSRPMTHWLGLVKTARARSHIRHVLNATSRADSITLGKKLLARALTKISSTHPENIKENHMRALLKANNMITEDELYLAIGLGKMLSDIAARSLLRRHTRRQENVRIDPVPIIGAGNAAITLSTCCYPLPSEPIVGILQKTQGLNIHADQCPLIQTNARLSEKWVDVAWDEKSETTLHRSAIYMECRNRLGLASVISSAINTQNVNIVAFNFNQGARDYDSLSIEAIVEISSLAALNRLLKSLEDMPDVIEARRHQETPKKNPLP